MAYGKVKDFSGCLGWVGGVWDLLTIGRAEAKRLLRSNENVNVKDVVYSAKCGVHIIVFDVTERVVAYPPPKDGKEGRV